MRVHLLFESLRWGGWGFWWGRCGLGALKVRKLNVFVSVLSYYNECWKLHVKGLSLKKGTKSRLQPSGNNHFYERPEWTTHRIPAVKIWKLSSLRPSDSAKLSISDSEKLSVYFWFLERKYRINIPCISFVSGSSERGRGGCSWEPNHGAFLLNFKTVQP